MGTTRETTTYGGVSSLLSSKPEPAPAIGVLGRNATSRMIYHTRQAV